MASNIISLRITCYISIIIEQIRENQQFQNRIQTQRTILTFSCISEIKMYTWGFYVLKFDLQITAFNLGIISFFKCKEIVRVFIDLPYRGVTNSTYLKVYKELNIIPYTTLVVPRLICIANIAF